VRLLLMRHGDAVIRANTDFDRDLSLYGIEQVKSAAANVMRSGLVVERVIASPYKRAQQTAEIMSSELKIAFESYDDITPDSDPREALAWLSGLQQKNILVVTHNPFVSYLLALLINGDFDTAINMPTASIACIECEIVGVGLGAMDWFYDSTKRI